jgi:hypothetical protein
MRSRLILLGVCLSAFVLVPGAATAQTVDAALEADIVKLMEATGATKIGEQMATIFSARMVEVVRQLRPDLPQRGVQVVNEVMTEALASGSRGASDLMVRMVPLYAKHFTRDEVRALLAFYQTDAGRKAVSVMPTLMQEGAQVGQEWARTMAPALQAEIEKRLRAEGLIK